MDITSEAVKLTNRLRDIEFALEAKDQGPITEERLRDEYVELIKQEELFTAYFDIRNKLEDAKQRELDMLEKLNRYENGYQGACYACETVGEKNLELVAQVDRMASRLAQYDDEIIERFAYFIRTTR